ncbi:hypothetical protein V1520DRAFT_358308 [Lipomyces starkeyi]
MDRTVLKLTLFVSNKRPQISLTVPIYYELHDLLDDTSERRGSFSRLDMDIALVVKNGMKKYENYYTFMDESDTYYAALVLDPRVKGDLLRSYAMMRTPVALFWRLYYWNFIGRTRHRFRSHRAISTA